MAWEYKREESQAFTVIPEGPHRVRIDKAERQTSKSGRDMIKLELAVSGYSSHLFHYIVFLEDKPQITNRNLTQFFDSFQAIAPGDFDISHWQGKAGAAMVKHEEYNGDTTARVRYFIKAAKAEELPAWREPSKAASSAPTPAPGAAGVEGFMNIPEDDDNLPIW